MRYEDVETYLKMSLENLGLNYIDMYMIHVPFAFKKDEKMEVAYSDDGTAIIDPTTDHIAIWKVKLIVIIVTGKVYIRRMFCI